MADTQVGNVHGIAGRGGRNINGGDDAQAGFNLTGNALSISSMRTRLTAINAGYYTAAKLNNLSYNDMIYAIRQNDAPGTI